MNNFSNVMLQGCCLPIFTTGAFFRSQIWLVSQLPGSLRYQWRNLCWAEHNTESCVPCRARAHNVKNACSAQGLWAQECGLLRHPATASIPQCPPASGPLCTVRAKTRESCSLFFYCTDCYKCKDHWHLLQCDLLQGQTVLLSVQEKLWCV